MQRENIFRYGFNILYYSFSNYVLFKHQIHTVVRCTTLVMTVHLLSSGVHGRLKTRFKNSRLKKIKTYPWEGAHLSTDTLRSTYWSRTLTGHMSAPRHLAEASGTPGAPVPVRRRAAAASAGQNKGLFCPPGEDTRLNIHKGYPGIHPVIAADSAELC